jgi:ribonuclease P protein component
MSIPREHRLRKHAEFELVYKAGKRHFSQSLTAFYLQREKPAEEAGARIGITVGRALGKATVRNRIKRRVRAAVAQNLSRLTADVDVVINPKKAVFSADFQQVCAEVARAFDVIEQKAPTAVDRQEDSAKRFPQKSRIAVRNT